MQWAPGKGHGEMLRRGWLDEQRTNATQNDRFGGALAASGDRVIIGAHARAAGAGGAYLFKRTGESWVQEGFLDGSYPPFTNQFGFSVAISGDRAVVGANTEDSAYVYRRVGSTRSQPTVLKAANAGDDDFGCSVAVDGGVVAVGAFTEDSNAREINGDPSNNNASDAGAAYVFAIEESGRFLSIIADGAGGFFLRCSADAGTTYELHRAASVMGPWTTNGTFTAAVSGVVEFHETTAPAGQAFYRIAAR